jgi:hypothetical protein
MKQILTFLIILISNIFYSQNISENRTFENLDKNLYKTIIIEVDSTNRTDLQNSFKKITAKLFVNLDKIIVNETDNQIVINFISTTKSTPTTSWNVRMISEFKDSRIRLRIFDRGNVYIPSGQYTPTWNESSFFVTNNKRAVKKKRERTLNEWMNIIDNLIIEIENGLKNSKIDNDW